MPRINIELTVDGEADSALRAIDHLLDHGVLQELIEGRAAESGERELHVMQAVSVLVVPRAVVRR